VSHFRQWPRRRRCPEAVCAPAQCCLSPTARRGRCRRPARAAADPSARPWLGTLLSGWRSVADGAGTAQLRVCRPCGQPGARRLPPRVRLPGDRLFPRRWPAPGAVGGTARGVAAGDQVRVTDSHHPALRNGTLSLFAQPVPTCVTHILQPVLVLRVTSHGAPATRMVSGIVAEILVPVTTVR
jgi:hypothetical protein